MSKSSNGNQHGFSLLEVIIALAILVVGLSALAALAAVMLGNGRSSKYTSLAGTLASEKLEDLSHWNGAFDSNGNDISDPHICIQAGDTAEGGINTAPAPHNVDTSNTITCNGFTQPVTYYDNVSIDITNATDCPNPADGCFAESQSVTSNGTTTYYTTYHSPDGTIPGYANGGSPSTPGSSTTAPTHLTFHRQWLIEPSPTVNGTQVTNLRRITVLVTLLDTSVKPSVTFQMSTIRP
jgi:prepilin-type N-terminal cleavage/methylation domain-containing protein